MAVRIVPVLTERGSASGRRAMAVPSSAFSDMSSRNGDIVKLKGGMVAADTPAALLNFNVRAGIARRFDSRGA
jgi:hypothetical protein